MFGFLCGQLDPNHKPNPTLVDEVLDTMVRRRPTGETSAAREVYCGLASSRKRAR